MTKPEIVLNEIREILWPNGDEDHEWDSETIETIARALHEQGYGPKKETCRHYQGVPGQEGQSCEACRDGE